MGWNGVRFVEDLEDDEEATFGMDEEQAYYFVHSYRAKYDSASDIGRDWAHTVTQYGSELFVSSVRKGNVFAAQFHPEKSGRAGLGVLDAWLKAPVEVQTGKEAHGREVRQLDTREKDGFIKRVVACLDVRANDEGDLVVTKGDQYDVREKSSAPLPSASASTPALPTKSAGAVRNLGKPVALAERYYASGADEICFLNITSFRSSPLHDQPMLAVVRAAAEKIFVPLTIGGGIKVCFFHPPTAPYSCIHS